MKLSDSLHEHIAAAFTGIWIQSHEHEDALAKIGVVKQALASFRPVLRAFAPKGYRPGLQAWVARAHEPISSFSF